MLLIALSESENITESLRLCCFTRYRALRTVVRRAVKIEHELGSLNESSDLFHMTAAPTPSWYLHQ